MHSSPLNTPIIQRPYKVIKGTMRRSWLLAAGVVATLCCCIEFAVGQNVEAEQPPKALVETPEL